MKLPNLSFLIAVLLFGPFLLAQQQEPHQLFDKLVSLENTDLASGTEYIELHIIRNNKHKYFLSDEFIPGDLTYDGQVYKNIPMKYNIYDDLLLINLINSGGQSTVLLHKEQVEDFQLQGYEFINLQLPEEQPREIEGFYELLYESKAGLLLKKHRQKILKHLDRNFTYFEFEPEEPGYVIFRDNTYTPFKTRRDLVKIFPDMDKEIRQFYRSHKSLEKSDRDAFLIRLIETLHNSVPQT